MKNRRDLLAYLLIVVGLAWYTHHLDSNQTHRNCLAIENLKAGHREAAQATIAGDRKLLEDHDLRGVPLPVPRSAINGDITKNLKVVHRFPERSC